MNQSLCDSRRLVDLLENVLSQEEWQRLTEHLEHCDSCAKELEQLAASAECWKEAKIHLSGQTENTVPSFTPERNHWGLPLPVRQVVSMLAPTDDPQMMGRLGGYEVMGVVGSGAMGVVLKVVDRTLDRVVALKVMNPTLATCGSARYRFAREAKAAAGILHPNVIPVHGVSTEGELPFLVMPYIGGSSLQQRMNQQGPLQLVEILRLGSQIAAGLAAAHQGGLIHRDIKPSNILLDKGVETALITDFGLARTIDDATMTRTGTITGTPEYMSPEQARGDSLDPASDVFSLASLLYALCTGMRPFRAKTTFGVLRKINDEEPTPIRELNPDIPEWLCDLIGKMHSKSPEDRPSSARVHEQLTACLAHVYRPDQIPLPKSVTTASSSQTPVWRSRLLFQGLFTMLTFLLVAILLSLTPSTSFFADSSTERQNEPEVFKTHQLKFPDETQKGKLIVDINRGSILLEGHDRPDVWIEILTPPKLPASTNLKNDEQQNEFQALFTPKYDLDIDQPDNSIKFDAYNQDYPLNLRIKVPHQTDLSLASYRDGDIVVKNIIGSTDAHSEHGNITLLDIAGSATAYSRNGDLRIILQDVSPKAKLDFESYNGSIDLSLPKSIHASTAIACGTSQCLTAFAILPVEEGSLPESILNKVKANRHEYQLGEIQGGGVPLRIESEKGTVTIRKTSERSAATGQ